MTQSVDIGELDSFASLGFPRSSHWLEQCSYGLIILIESIVHTAAMNGHAVETASHLIQNGVNAAKAVAHEPEMHDLDVSKLTVSLTKSPGKVPEPDSLEIWDMKTCTDHSTGSIRVFHPSRNATHTLTSHSGLFVWKLFVLGFLLIFSQWSRSHGPTMLGGMLPPLNHTVNSQ